MNSENSDLKDLVKAAQLGERESLALLVETVQDRLLRFCMYISGNNQFAQDLCQDTLIRAIENLSQLKEASDFKSWLFSIARNLFLDHVRSPRNKEHVDVDKIDPSILSDDGKRLEKIMLIRETLAQLESEERMILALIDLEGSSYEEAALVLGTTEDAIRLRLHRARKAFVEKYRG